MAEPARPWAATAEGVTLTVRLTPRAGRDRIGEVAEIDGRPVLRVAVAAPAVEGQANAALAALLAARLGVAKTAVRLVRGQGARVKTLGIAGDPQALAARLAAALAAD